MVFFTCNGRHRAAVLGAHYVSSVLGVAPCLREAPLTLPPHHHQHHTRARVACGVGMACVLAAC